MRKMAYLFPGQGAQAVGMGKDLVANFKIAKEVFEAADDALGMFISRLCFEGPADELKRTAITQPAILTCSVAALQVLQSETPVRPAVVLGHSLGEYSALVAAGALKLSDAVRAVHSRGTFMQEAVPQGEGAMAAIMGLDAAQIRVICTQCSEPAKGKLVAAANFNTPVQTVISGHKKGVDKALPLLKEAGAKRAVPLPVSAPFHCELMAPVAPRLKEVLDAIEIGELSVPLMSNVEAAPYQDRGHVVELLVAQVTAPVRWVESVQALKDLEVEAAIEIGPGKTLGGMVKRINRDVEISNVEDADSLKKTLQLLG